MSRLMCCLLLATAVVFGAHDGSVVKTPNGQLQGTIRKSRKGLEFHAFEGIPYANPPVGDLRFAEPQPAEPWTGVWNASNYYQCIQLNHDPRHLGLVEGEEDCLYLNLYTPYKQMKTFTNDELLDVIVHIHGGAFMFGHADSYGPDNIMDKNVIYVNFNYRLGPLGFLSTEDNVVPGNNGLKDQVLALKWIKDNIQYFGGNPMSITITGLSAGGSSVHYHYLSPLSKGLFQKGISVSGTALCNWALVEQPLVKTRQLGEIVGCTDKSTKSLVECLRRRSAKQIVQSVKNFQPWLYNPYSPFGPVVEQSGSHSFLPDYPYNLLKNGKVQDLPWLTSVTSEEGLYPASEFLYEDDHLPYLEKNWEELAPHILHYEDTVSSKKEAQKLSKKIKKEYLHNQKITRKNFPELVQMIGDRLFVVDGEKSARLQAKVNKSPVYFYKYSYRAAFSVSEYLSHSTVDVGVCHADDAMMILSADKSWFKEYLAGEPDNLMCELLLDVWASFARTGKPTIPDVEWRTVLQTEGENIHYMHIISPEKQQMENASQLGRRSFWDSLPLRENDRLNNAKDEL